MGPWVFAAKWPAKVETEPWFFFTGLPNYKITPPKKKRTKTLRCVVASRPPKLHGTFERGWAGMGANDYVNVKLKTMILLHAPR